MLTSGVTKVDLGFKESSSLSLRAVLKNRKRKLYLIDSIVDGNSLVTEIVSREKELFFSDKNLAIKAEEKGQSTGAKAMAKDINNSQIWGKLLLHLLCSGKQQQQQSKVDG